MEKMVDLEILSSGSELISSEDTGSTTKGLIVGASVVGIGWLSTYLFKKFKSAKPEETIVEESL